MKKFKTFISVVTLLILTLISTNPIKAEDYTEDAPYYITYYYVDIVVAEDNTYSIREEIEVYFNEERHGIIRTIPIINKIEREDGTSATVRTKVNNITCNEPFSTDSEGSDVDIQIGDPDTTVTGYMTYEITYDYVMGQDVGQGYDEFYFNIIGDNWDTYIENVVFRIEMPKDFDESLLGFSTGGYGFGGSDIVEYYTDGTVIEGYVYETLEPFQALTIRLELEEGYFYFDMVKHVFIISTMALIPLALLILTIFFWLKFGKDEPVIDTVEFYPPEGMKSIEVAYWYKGKLPKKDIIALLIELANEGYVAIHSEGDSDEYSIERLKPYPSHGDRNKRDFFYGLFESGKDIVTGDDLENRFYRTLNTIGNDYTSEHNGIYMYNATSQRLQLLVWALAIGIFILNVWILISVIGGAERYIPFVIGILILVLACYISKYISKRTDESHHYLEKITGFRRFLETAEKDRLEALVNEDPQYFYNILPYAYVLDVSDVWVEKFENIAIESPNWYVGAGAFTAYGMWRTMDRTMSSATKSMTSAPRRSSSGGGSGSSGGGVSGGGSGGGGGRSW